MRMTHVDKFWRYFWYCFLVVLIGCLSLFVALAQVYNPLKIAEAAAVGVAFDPSHDPFARSGERDARPPFVGEYFYSDSLPLSFADWSWGVNADWASTEHFHEGSRSIRVTFNEQWAGLRAAASPIDLSDYQGLSLAILPDEQVKDLYIQLYDIYGKPFPRQSVGWYTDEKELQPGKWTVARIPFKNLFPAGQKVQEISGYSIGSEALGVAYIDTIHLESSVAAHSRWEEPKYVAPAEIPADPVFLPYELSFTPSAISEWRAIFGRFDLTRNAVYIGPIAEKSTGSMAFLPGAKDWKDYRVDTVTYWGPVLSFSLLVRFVDDANFVSCAFSDYDGVAQLYVKKDGVSRLVGASPSLSIRAFEPWKDAKAGASVVGNRVTCYVDGEKALSYEVPDMASAGGIGVESWTKNTYDQPHRLESLKVTPL